MNELTPAVRKKVAKAILDSDYDFDTMMREIPSGTVGDKIMNEAQEMDNELFDGLIYWAQSNIKAKPKTKERVSLYEKNRRAVYATGNKWAIENWNATH